MQHALVRAALVLPHSTLPQQAGASKAPLGSLQHHRAMGGPAAGSSSVKCSLNHDIWNCEVGVSILKFIATQAHSGLSK